MSLGRRLLAASLAMALAGWAAAPAAAPGLGLRGAHVSAEPSDAPAEADDEDTVEQPLWALYGRHDYAGVRSRITRIEETRPDWEASRQLMEQLTLGEMRDRLLRASASGAFAVVIKVAAANKALLTCTNMDVMWRTAEAFVRLDQMHQALAAYTNILRSCPDPAARLATMRKAASLLKSQDALDSLLALGQRDASGRDEFEGLRLDPVRPAAAVTQAGLGEAPSPADLDAMPPALDPKPEAADAPTCSARALPSCLRHRSPPLRRRSRPSGRPEAQNPSTAIVFASAATPSARRPGSAHAPGRRATRRLPTYW